MSNFFYHLCWLEMRFQHHFLSKVTLWDKDRPLKSGEHLTALTSRAVILPMISEIAVLSKVPMALQYIFTGRTSCHTIPSLFSWCSTCQESTAADPKRDGCPLHSAHSHSAHGYGERDIIGRGGKVIKRTSFLKMSPQWYPCQVKRRLIPGMGKPLQDKPDARRNG